MRLWLEKNELQGEVQQQFDVSLLPVDKRDRFVQKVQEDAVSTVEEAETLFSEHTEAVEHLDCDLILTSVGYAGESIEGIEANGSSSPLPFDDRGRVVKNTLGVVASMKEGEAVLEEGESNDLFVVGWIKRGASGIIGSNIVDARQTVDTLISLRGSEGKEAESNDDDSSPIERYLEQTLQIPSATQIRKEGFEGEGATFYVNWEDAKRLDRYEQTHLQHPSQARNKLTSMEKIQEILFSN